jgi:hypothetical protein
MSRIDEIKRQRRDILSELARLEQMRRGSIIRQVFRSEDEEGKLVERGPYPLYTFKKKGRTVSRRITVARHVGVYERQIGAFRRFEVLTGELVQLGEELSDLALSDDTELKKRPKSRSSRVSS